MKLCSYCIANVLQSQESWNYHHASYKSLSEHHQWDFVENAAEKKSKKEHCLFCWTLHQDLEKLAPGLKDVGNSGAWPVYRWNVRSLSKIRESLETVVVTFRYVPSEEGEVPDDFVEVKLPTRTFFLFPEEDIKPLPNIAQIGKSTDPVVNGGHQIRSWVKTCDATHTDCMKRRRATPKSQRFLPTRLLDITGPPEKPIRLVETASMSIQGSYCSVSHCWGDPKLIIKLLKETRKPFMEIGVEWHLLAKNFQESIEIARALDVGYIWIDSLCIMQDSAEDWDHEAARMHLVYRNSYCNIAIVDSADSRGGAFRTRDPQDIVPVRYQPSITSPHVGQKPWIIVPEFLWDRELLQSFLYVRGWVFQERMLSARILHFAKNQIFWDCPSLSACETLPGGLPNPMDKAAGPDRHWRSRLQEPEDNYENLAGVVDQSMNAFWKTAVSKYTDCNLTMGKDKLIAMWGVAKLVRDAMGVEYGEGLWEENLEDQLAWRVKECKLLERPSESSTKTIARKIPSWSWASMDGAIVVPDRLSDQQHFKITDHNGRNLTFDLKGVRSRGLAPALTRPGRENSPGLQRGNSDTKSVLQLRSQQLHKENPDHRDEKAYHRASSPETISKDAPPEFYSTSIRIQGHVRRGRLVHNEAGTGWILKLDGVNDGVFEAFPDLVPQTDISPYVIVLAAKQVVKAPILALEGAIGSQSDTFTVSSFAQSDKVFDHAGHGILMKDVGNHHFHRIGAFRFEAASEGTFKKLQETDELESIAEGFYSAQRGRKFWLD